jgi:hypothetical protein
MPNLLRKLTFSFLSALVVFFAFAPYLSVKAQESGTWYNQDFNTWLQKVNDPNPTEIFGERYTAAQVQWVMYGLINFLLTTSLPQDVISCIFANTIDVNTCKNAIEKILTAGPAEPNLANTDVKPSLLGSVLNTNRSFSGIGYINNKISNFRIVPTAKAQGVGYSALNTVQSLWIGVRNMSYGLFALIAVIFAFMIMFRMKLSPQTVISVQSALPKIVMGLILVTFSYAIAGLLIDLLYVVIGIVSVLMSPLIPTVPILQTKTYTPPDLFNLLTVGPSNSVGGILGLLMMYLTPLFIATVILLIISIALAVPTGTASFWIGIALVAIVFIVALWMSIKILWVLFKAFANILLLTIFAPIQITMGIVIPNMGISQWIRSFLSNLSVFVVTGILWLFAWIFMLSAWNNAFPGGNLTVNLSGGVTANAWPPLLGTGGGPWPFLIFLGVSFVLFTMIPKSTELVQAFLTGKPFAYGSAVGEALGPIGWAYGASGAKDVAEMVKFGRMNQTLAGLTENKRIRTLLERMIAFGSPSRSAQTHAQDVVESYIDEKRKKSGYTR